MTDGRTRLENGRAVPGLKTWYGSALTGTERALRAPPRIAPQHQRGGSGHRLARHCLQQGIGAYTLCGAQTDTTLPSLQIISPLLSAFLRHRAPRRRLAPALSFLCISF